MLIGVIGAPCSGKTTTVAMAYATLKEFGLPCEFLPEQARFYIAAKKVEMGLSPQECIVLGDDDQYEIMEQQGELEQTLLQAVGENVPIMTDSSVLLSLLYLSDEGCKQTMPYLSGDFGDGQTYHQHLAEKSIRSTDLWFYAKPVAPSNLYDPNRIHTHEQSLAIDQKIQPVFQAYLPEIWDKFIVLDGTPAHRCATMVSAIMEKMETPCH